MDHTITLTDAQYKALSYVAFDPQDWIENAVFERCRIATEDIVKICVEKCLANDIQIPGSKDAMIELAFSQGWITALADVKPSTVG